MAKTQIGTAAINWGTLDETWGYVESLSVKYTAEKEEVKNGVGDIVAAIYHGHKVSVSGNFTITGTTGLGAAEVAIGSAITFKTEGSSTITGYIDSWGKEYKRGASTTRSFEATFYPSLVTA